MAIYESDYQRNLSSEAVQQREGGIARRIERSTARIPSDTFLWGAGLAMLGSLAFQVLGARPRVGIRGLRMMMLGRRMERRAPLATFIGQWVPTLLLFGIYNKIVKVGGSDRLHR